MESTNPALINSDRLNNVFINRDKEIKAIKIEFSAVLCGRMGLATVAGRAGIGKTSLVKRSVDYLEGNTFICGKSKQKDSALSCVSEVLNSVTDHLLTLPHSKLEEIKQELVKSLSDDISLIAAISPRIINLLEVKHRFETVDFNRLKYRVKNAVFKYIGIASKFLFPLIVFIDDIQWADPLSIEIIKTLVNKKQGLNMLFVLSYRDNETTAYMSSLVNILANKSKLLLLDVLSSSDIRKYINTLFDSHINGLEQLTSLVQGLTLGNPFYVKETLLILMQEKIMKYSSSKNTWSIQINRMNSFFINSDVKKILKKKVTDKENLELLEIVACFNGKIEYRFLRQFCDIDERELQQRLDRLLDDAILMKQEENGCTLFLFTHDIIYKLVLLNLDTKHKQSTHYKIAENLLLYTSPNVQNKENIITTHLLKADRETVYSDVDKWIILVFKAGIKEKQKASLEEALKILELCKFMLSRSRIENKNIYLKLHLELAECLSLVGRQQESQRLMNGLAENFVDKDSRVAIKRKQLYIYYYQREHKKTIRTGVLILKDLRFGFGRYRILLDLLASRIIYSNKRISSLSEASGAIDQKVSVVLDTLTIMNACAAVSDDKLTAPIGLSAALASAKCGETANSLVGYISYAYILLTVWNDLPKTKMMVSQIVKMSDRISDHSNKSMVYFMIGAFLSHWSAPIEEADGFLQKGIEYGELSGDFLFLGHCITTSLDTKSFMGKSLNNISNYIESCKTKFAETEQYATTYNYEAHLAHVTLLKFGGDDSGFDKVGSKYPKLTPFEKLTENALQMERLFISGRLDEAYRLADIVLPHIKSVKGLICRQSIIFYSLLTRISIHSSLAVDKQHVNKKHIKRFLKELSYFADLCDKNFGCYYILAEAEYRTYIKDQANELYDRAAGMAEQQQNYKIAALANLLAAKKHISNKKMSSVFASESARLYKLWGADYISGLIQSKYKFYDSAYLKTDTALLGKVTKTKQEILHTFVKQVSGKNEDETAKMFLAALIAAGLADYCCVITSESGRMHLKHQMDKMGNLGSYAEKIKISNLSRLPHKVLRYSARAHKEVYIYPDRNESVFDDDPCISANPNTFFACIPIVNCGVTTGLLYFENTETPLDEQTLSEITNLLPMLAVSFNAINGVDIKALFTPARIQTLLTNREMDILKLIEKGLSNEGIGAELKLSVGTVKKHVSSILNKLSAENRIQALIKAKDMKIL